MINQSNLSAIAISIPKSYSLDERICSVVVKGLIVKDKIWGFPLGTEFCGDRAIISFYKCFNFLDLTMLDFQH